MSVFVEERLRWLEGKLSLSLTIKTEHIKTVFTDTTSKEVLLDFLNNEDIRRLYVGVGDSGLVVSTTSVPETSKNLVFLKGGHVGKVRKDSIEESIILFDISKSSVEQIEGLMDCVFVPLILSEDTYRGEKMMENLHKLASILQITAGNERGDVVLPVPLLEVLLESSTVSSNVIVILETTIISWTKQIKLALKLDLDRALRAQNVVGPIAELKVWEERQTKLNSILEQLDSRLASQILKELANLGNVYAKSFSVVVDDIKQALTETQENIMYLRPFEPYLMKLANITATECSIKITAPIVHLLDLIWRHSRYYHEPKNFKRLLRHLSHLVVSSAHSFVGPEILNDTETAFVNLKHALRLCAKFRGCYLDKREKSNEYNKLKISENDENKKADGGIKIVTGPFITMHMKRNHGMFSINNSDTIEKDPDMWTNSPWPPRNASPFAILNSFMERANDVLDLVQTAQHFKNLESVAEIGGVGNRSLDTIVSEIHGRFNAAMVHFMGLTEQNILDISKQDQEFEQEFFTFRALVRDLESQMAHVMRICFDRCANTSAHIRLLEVFAGVSGRESVQRSLTDKLESIVTGMMEEVLNVKEILERNTTSPNHRNMPDTASRVCWLKALRSRIQKPMEKLKDAIPEILNNNQGWKLRVQYDSVIVNIEEALRVTEHVWRRDIKSELTSKLTQNLYVDVDGGPLIKVNLDRSLLLVLKEVHYVSSPENVPPTILSLLDQVDTNTLKVTAARLETIASHYNKLRSKIRPHEEHLFTAKIAQMETLLNQGKKTLTWKSLETDDFIEEATSLILEDSYKKLSAVQAAQSQIEAKVAHWHEYLCQSLFTSEEPCFIEDWIVRQKEHFPSQVSEGYAVLANMYGNKISSLVKGVHTLLQISENSPAWQSYLAHLDDLISTGLTGAMEDALTQLYNLISLTDPADKPKILVRIELIGGMVQYHPPIDKASADISVQEMVYSWVTRMVDYCQLIPRLLPECQSYAKVISSNPAIIDLIAKIQQVMEDNHVACQQLQNDFMMYSYLWKDDAHQTFSQFISGRVGLPFTPSSHSSTKDPISRPASMLSTSVIVGQAERNFLAPSLSTGSGSVGRVPTLDDFDRRIAQYQTAFNTITAGPDEESIGWLRVDIKPIKQVLTTHASRWVYVFTEYLINQCNKMLGNIETFLLETEPQIEELIKTLSISPADAAIAPSAYMQLVELFNKVTSKQQEFDSKFGAVRKTVVLLNKYNFHMEKEEFFLAAPSRWSNLRAKVVLAKQRIAPKMQLRSEQISHDLREFSVQCQKSREDFAGCEAFLRTCSFATAHELLKNFKITVSELEEKSKNLVELQELLEAHIVDFTCISEFKSDIETLEKVWTTSKGMKGHHSLWRNGHWKSLNLGSITHETECQLLELRSLPENAHSWDVYCGLIENITQIQECVPIVKSLSNSSMRARHWKLLVRTLGAQHSIAPDRFQEASLKELLDLGLLSYKDEILAICQRAETDVQMEFSLQNCEEVWLSKVFDLKSVMRKRVNIQLQADYDGNARMELVKTTRDSQVIGSFGSDRSRAYSIGSKDSKQTDQNSYKESEPVSVLTNTDSIFECLWNHEMILDSIMVPGSAFSDDISKWQKKLQTVEQALKTWVSVQEKWMEMEEMFALTAVIVSLNSHARIYAQIDMEFTQLMKSVAENPNIVQQCCRPGVLANLKGMLEKLATCEKALTEFTHKQCSRLPRFYFLSARDVFHILCHGHDLSAISSYIGRLLPTISQLEVDTSTPSQPVVAVSSELGEILNLHEPIPTDVDVFEWLKVLIDVLKTSVTADLNAALKLAEFQFDALNDGSWIFHYSAESVLLAIQILLGKDLRDSYRSKTEGNKSSLLDLLNRINTLIGVLQRTLRVAGEELRPRLLGEEDVPPSDDELPLSSVSQTQHTPVRPAESKREEAQVEEPAEGEERLQLVPHQLEKIRNALLALLSLRNLARSLEDEEVKEGESFTLKSQLSYEMSDQGLVVQVLNNSYKYGYEYQGSSQRIVSTPDTDRARLGLFAACNAYNGTVILGQRGHGKTELVRDISRCLGETLYMFSYTSSTTIESIRDVCLGMASSGCHVCLEGLPSLDPGIFSLLVVAVRGIMSAISQEKDMVHVMDYEVSLLPTGRCFGTALKSAGAALPQVIQGVFRLISLDPPQEETIYEALLLSHGFLFASRLAANMVSLLKSFKSLVHSSVYSLNNVKAWFADAADRREYILVEGEESTLEIEEEIVVVAMRDIITPRLSEQHATLLQHLLLEHYPGVNFNRSPEENMTMTESRLLVALQSTSDLNAAEKSEPALFVDPKEALAAVLKESNIKPTVTMIAKLSQLALLLSTQKIVIVAGQAGTGKTSCISTVAQAHREMGTSVNLETVVTQALKPADLFGSYASDSCSWDDGIFTMLLKQFNMTSESEGYSWLTLDGPVSSSQLDTLTTLLHSDNTLLLPNSSRVKAAENVRIIWEMEDLSSLSPTTCATAGIFVITSDPDMWERVLEQELEKLENEEFLATSKSVLRDIIALVTSGRIVFAMSLTVESAVRTFSAIVLSLLETHTLETVLVDSLVVYAAAWAFGGALQADSQTKFNDFCLKKWPFPQANAESTVWDLVLGENCVQLAESPSSPTAGLSNEVNTGSPFLHTHAMRRCIHVMNLCTNVQRPVLLIGELGVGKTLLMREKLRNSQALEGLQVTLNCDNFTDGYVLSNRLHEHMEWKAANYYDPKNSRYLISFIDNLNMAKVEGDGQATLSETIRQHIDHTFIFNKSTMSLNHLRNTVYNVTCDVQHNLSPRFTRHFATFALHYPNKEAMQSIFTAVTKAKLSSCSINSSKLSELSEDRLSQEEITPDLVSSIIKITIELQDRLRSMYLPTKERCHYLFTFRTIAHVFRNLIVSLKPKENTAKDLLLLWSHETMCGYSYRMISTVDKERFHQVFAMAAKKHFAKDDYVALCTSPEQPLFSSILDSDSHYSYEGGEGTLREYRAMYDTTNVVSRMQHNISEFVKHHGSLHMELYQSTISLISRVVHILHNPHDIGHVLLAADGCSDIAYKIACLAASILGATVVSPTYSPESPSSYHLQDFCADFTAAIVEAGVKGKKIMFLLQEHEATDPEFLVHVSEYVSSCSVAGLFSSEEQLNIGNSLRSDLTQAGVSFNHDVAFQFFLKNVQENLRVVMTTSTDNVQLWQWSSRYPSMLNCINVLWVPHWDSSELLHVAKYHLNGCQGLTPKEINNLGHLLTNIHKTSSHDMVFNNSDFEKFVKKFVVIYHEQSLLMTAKRSHLEKSLACIRKVAAHAEVLEARLSREGTVLVEKDEGVNNILVQLGRDTAIIEAHKLMLKQQQDKVAQIQQALPQLEIQRKRYESDSKNINFTIKDALGQLTTSSLTELRSINKPDSNIEDIIVAVIMLLKSPMADLTWNKGGKRMLAGIDRLIELLNQFDENPLPDKALESVTQLLNSHAFSVEYQEKDHAISCVPILSLWVVGVVKYHVQLLNKVQPAIIRVEKATQALEIAKQKLTVMESKISVLQERLDGLQGSYEQATIDKDLQNSQTIKMKTNLTAAASFTDALQNMEKTWGAELDRIPLVKEYLEGCAAIAAAATVYMGNFPYDDQIRLAMEKWVPCLKEHSIPVTLSTEGDLTSHIVSTVSGFIDKEVDGAVNKNTITMSEVLTLISKKSGLLKWDTRHGPTQAHLLGIVSSHCSWTDRPQFPLLIDPDGVGYQRIQELEHENKLVMIDMSNSESRALSAIGRAITLGLPTILLNIGTDIPPVIYPLFEQRRHVDGDVETIKLGGQKFQYHPNFRLYLATTEPESRMSRTLLSYTPVVDFTLTTSLVRELLLTALLANLFPVLGWVLETVPRKIETVSLELEKTSDLLTDKLNQEVETEIDGLNSLLQKQEELNEKLRTLLQCKQKCSQISSSLSKVLDRCCTLYSGLLAMRELNSNYIIPFKTFKSWIVDSVEVAAPPQIKQGQVNEMSEAEILDLLSQLTLPDETIVHDMVQSITKAIWDKVSLIVFKNDSLIVGMLFSIMIATNFTDLPHVVQQVLSNKVTLEDGSQDLGVSDKPDWVATEEQWHSICALEKVRALVGLPHMIDRTWEAWLEEPGYQPSPGIWHATQPPAEGAFYDLLLTHILQPLHLKDAYQQYVANVEPIFSNRGKMCSLSELGSGKPILILNDRHCPNKVINYLEDNLTSTNVRMVTVGSSTSNDLADMFADDGCLVLHKVELGDKAWLQALRHHLTLLNKKLEFAAQGVMNLLSGLGSLSKSPRQNDGVSKCILTVDKDVKLPEGLVKLCAVVSVDTLIPPLDMLHLPTLCSSNILPSSLTSKTMRIAILHSIVQQYWVVYKSQPAIPVSVTMAIEETQKVSETADIVNVLVEVVYSSMLETRHDRELVRCLAERIFSTPDSVLLDQAEPVGLPPPETSWDEWVENNIPITLDFVGLSEHILETKVLARNQNLSSLLGKLMNKSGIIQSSALSPLVLVQRRIVEYLEIIPPALPDHVTSSQPVGGTQLYNYWLTREIEEFCLRRGGIVNDLSNLHTKLVQGFSNLTSHETDVYQAIYKDTPLPSWLYQDIERGDLTNLAWFKVLTEGQQQLVRLHEGGSGIWAGCLSDFGILLQSLIQEKGQADKIPTSKICLKVRFLGNIPANERTQIVAVYGGILVSGLRLLRAGWSLEKQELIEGLPDFSPYLAHIYPSSELEPASWNTYNCPLYIDQKVPTPIAEFQFTSNKPTAHWKLLSVCLVVVRSKPKFQLANAIKTKSLSKSSLFDIQSKEHIHAHKALIRASSFAVPRPCSTPLASRPLSACSPKPLHLVPTPPLSSKPSSRRPSVASQILVRKVCGPRSRSGSRSESPLISQDRRRSRNPSSEDEVSLPGSPAASTPDAITATESKTSIVESEPLPVPAVGIVETPGIVLTPSQPSGDPTPAAPTPEASIPAASTPAAALTPATSTPATPTPATPTPAAPTPGTPSPAAPTPAAPTPAASTPAAPTPAASTPAAPTSAAPTPATPTPAAPTPAAPTPAALTPAAPTPAAPTPAALTPEAPTPAAPTPAAPTPAAPTPAVPTPAAPTPAAPTPAAPTPASPTPSVSEGATSTAMAGTPEILPSSPVSSMPEVGIALPDPGVEAISITPKINTSTPYSGPIDTPYDEADDVLQKSADLIVAEDSTPIIVDEDLAQITPANHSNSETPIIQSKTDKQED